MVIAWALFTITILLVAGGCALFVLEAVGWAQFCWVMASGTAGAGVVLAIEDRRG